MSEFVKQCVMRRLKWSVLVIFGIILPMVLLFLIVGMLAGEYPWIEILLASSLGGVGAGIIGVPVMLYHPWRFVRMIRRQEEVLGLTFGEEEFTPTAPKASRMNQHYQFSDNWYMCEGSWALHRLYIVKVTQKSHLSGTIRTYRACVETVEGKTWKLYMESASDLKRFYRWWKAGRN